MLAYIPENEIYQNNNKNTLFTHSKNKVKNSNFTSRKSKYTIKTKIYLDNLLPNLLLASTGITMQINRKPKTLTHKNSTKL